MFYRELFVFNRFNMNREAFNRGFGDRANGELVDNLSHYFIHIYKADYGEYEVVRPLQDLDKAYARSRRILDKYNLR